jgi:hypothetical protein
MMRARAQNVTLALETWEKPMNIKLVALLYVDLVLALIGLYVGWNRRWELLPVFQWSVSGLMALAVLNIVRTGVSPEVTLFAFGIFGILVCPMVLCIAFSWVMRELTEYLRM